LRCSSLKEARAGRGLTVLPGSPETTAPR
jgi:hypothetical protein